MPFIESKQGGIYIEPESVTNYKWRFLVNPWYWISVILAGIIAVVYYGMLAAVGYPDIVSVSIAFLASMTLGVLSKYIFGW